MNFNQKSALNAFMAKSRVRVSLYLSDNCEDVLNEFNSCIKRELHCELFVPAALIKKAESDIFLLNKFLKIKSNGASLFVGQNEKADLQSACVSDYDQICLFKDGFKEIIYLNVSDERFSYYNDFFQAVHPEYRPSESDIKILFKCDTDTLLMHSSANLMWQVNNANYVNIDGIGRVSNYGEKQITILSDTFLKIKAFNDQQKKVKSIRIRAVEKLDIIYEIQFRNLISKKFVSLDESEYPGVFGVSKGTEVKLVWSAKDAESVKVKPFGFSQFQGEHQFEVKDFVEIKIEARLRNKIRSKRILIYEFPVAIFTHKFVKLDKKFILDRKFEIYDDRFWRLNSYLDNASYSFKNVMFERMEHAMKIKKSLLATVHGGNFQDFYEKNKVQNLNNRVKQRLLAYFKDNQNIYSTISSMKTYDE
jgi:hypothetical protein